jgi:hypothetical protein
MLLPGSGRRTAAKARRFAALLLVQAPCSGAVEDVEIVQVTDEWAHFWSSSQVMDVRDGCSSHEVAEHSRSIFHFALMSSNLISKL